MLQELAQRWRSFCSADRHLKRIQTDQSWTQNSPLLMQGLSRWTTQGGSFSDGLLKTPPEYKPTRAFCYIPMSPPQVLSLFQIRNAASDHSSTGYFSEQSHKLWQRMIILFYTQHYHRHGIACPDFLHLHHFCVTGALGTPKNLQIIEHIVRMWSS